MNNTGITDETRRQSRKATLQQHMKLSDKHGEIEKKIIIIIIR